MDLEESATRHTPSQREVRGAVREQRFGPLHEQSFGRKAIGSALLQNTDREACHVSFD